MSIVTFLQDRFAEDEREVARRRRWFGNGDPHSAGAIQIDRAEAECIAKRRILSWHDSVHECSGPNLVSDPEMDPPDGGYGGPCETVMALAAIYGGHPSFEPRWGL